MDELPISATPDEIEEAYRRAAHYARQRLIEARGEGQPADPIWQLTELRRTHRDTAGAARAQA